MKMQIVQNKYRGQKRDRIRKLNFRNINILALLKISFCSVILISQNAYRTELVFC